MTKNSKIACCVYGCLRKKSKDVDCQFFSLPTEETRRNEWLKKIGRTDLLEQTDLNPKSCHVCSLHFDEEMMKTVKYVPPNAVPTRFLPIATENSSNEQLLEYATATIDWDEIILNPPEIVTLESEDNKEIEDVPTNKTHLVIPGTRDGFDKNFCKLIEEQIKINDDTNLQNKETLFYALNMMILNPQAYCFINDDLNLPTEKAVRSIKLKLSPKLDNRVLDTLSSKLKSFPDKAKYCTVCIDSIFLKPNLYYDILNDELVGLQNVNGKKIDDCALVAYVMMLRSILVQWDQPVSYCFLASTKNFNELQKWIDTVITQLFEVGFEVMALITNQGNNLGKFARELKKISTNKTYFMVNEKKIYYIFEFPALLKCIRNHLYTKDLCYADNEVSLKHIETLVTLEKQRKHNFGTNLTNNHVKPSNFIKMITSYAADVFSKPVSDAIHAYVDMKMMPESARQTAKFCLFLNNLYDVLNSSSNTSDNVYKRALGSHESQMKLIEDALDLFRGMEVKSTGKGKRTIAFVSLPNILVTLQSIKALSTDMRTLGHKYIFTQRLNLNSLEMFLNFIRRTSANTADLAKPTPVQFCRNFSRLYVKYILKKSRYSIRLEAFEKFIKDASELRINRLDPIPSRISIVALNGDVDYRIKLPAHNPAMYIAGFLFYKCVQNHNCAMLKQYTKTLPDLSSAYNRYNIKAEFYGKLKMLHSPFIQYVRQLDKTIIQNFASSLCLNLGAKLFEILDKIPFDAPCRCFPRSYLVKLLIRLRIYVMIKRFNATRAQLHKKNVKEFISDLFDKTY